MPKLHELLAVRESARGQSEKVRTGLIDTFNKKRHLFGQKIVTFTSNKEGAAARTEEQSELQTTVMQELKWLTPIVAGALNVEALINYTNAIARADVMLPNGDVIIKDVPATALLELSKRLGEVKQFVEAIPTLDPAKGFRLDEQRQDGTYAARPVHKTRTAKEQRPIVLYDATKEHPAQTQLITQDVPIGTIEELEWSGLITPADKAGMIERVEELIRAVTSALSRANDAEAPSARMAIGEALLGYVFGS
jgi:hypothetical protein